MLDVIQYQVFRSLKKLEVLDLSYNRLPYILQIGILGHETLRSFKIKGNPLSCSRCYVAWLRNFNATIFTDHDEAICMEPAEMRGTPVWCYSLRIEFRACWYIALPSLDTFDYCDRYDDSGTSRTSTTNEPITSTKAINITQHDSENTTLKTRLTSMETVFLTTNISSAFESPTSISDLPTGLGHTSVMPQTTSQSTLLIGTTDAYTDDRKLYETYTESLATNTETQDAYESIAPLLTTSTLNNNINKISTSSIFDDHSTSTSEREPSSVDDMLGMSTIYYADATNLDREVNISTDDNDNIMLPIVTTEYYELMLYTTASEEQLPTVDKYTSYLAKDEPHKTSHIDRLSDTTNMDTLIEYTTQTVTDHSEDNYISDTSNDASVLYTTTSESHESIFPHANKNEKRQLELLLFTNITSHTTTAISTDGTTENNEL